MKFFQPATINGLPGTGTVTSVGFTDSLTSTPNPIVGSGTATLVNDVLAPGNNYYYGTNNSGTKGFFTLPSGLPAAPSTSIQFNDGGVFGGSANFEYNKVSGTATITIPSGIFWDNETNVNGTTYTKYQNTSAGGFASVGLRFYNDLGLKAQMLQLSSTNGLGADKFVWDGVAAPIMITSRTGNVDLGTQDVFDANAWFRLFNNGHIAVGPNPSDAGYPFDVQVNAHFGAAVADGTGSVGTAGQVLSSTVTGTQWITAGVGGITSINGDTTSAQLLTVGSTGADFNIDSVSTPGTSVFNLPDASATTRGALNSTDWSTFNSKLSSTLLQYHLFVGDNTNTAVDAGTSITWSGTELDITGNIILEGSAQRLYGQARNTTIGTPGQGLIIDAGGATPGFNNQDGGDLILKSGISTGTQFSAIRFLTAPNQGNSPADNPVTEKMVLNGNGSLQLDLYGAGTFTGTPTYNLSVDSSGNVIETTIPSIPTSLDVAETNGNAGTITKGMAVYASADDTVDLAQANAAGTKNVIGFVKDSSIVTTAIGTIATSGMLTATTGEWDAVTGDTGGLTFNSIYYLDPTTPGFITKTAPITAGQYVAPVGIALSTTTMKITILSTTLL